MNDEFTAALRSVGDAASAAALIRGDEAPAPATASTDSAAVSAAASAEAAAGTAEEEGAGRPFRIVAVTSCPTGIAHTYMAAESLENMRP